MDPIPPPPPPAPPVPPNAQQAQQQPSLLERLREQVARELMPNPDEEAARRFRTFGAALMGTRGDFFQGLAAGQQAIEQQRAQEQQARSSRLQQMEQEAQRQAELNLRQAEAAYNQDPNNPQNQLRLAQAQQALEETRRGRRPTFVQGTDPATGNLVLFDPESGRRVQTNMRPTQELRLQPRALGPADFARLRERATTEALREIPSIPGVTDPPGRIAQRAARENQLFEEFVRAEEAARALLAGGAAAGGGSGQPAPAAPNRTLQYPRPAPQTQQ